MAKQRDQLLDFTGEVQYRTTKFLPKKNEFKTLVNADTEVIGGLGKRLGIDKYGATLTSTSTTTTTSTSTSTSTSTTTS